MSMVEMAARMPWMHAKPGTWWEVSGLRPGGGNFTRCVACVLPTWITGHDVPMFEVLVFTDPYVVPASSVTSGRELIFVLASDPRTAYYESDQETVGRAVDEP